MFTVKHIDTDGTERLYTAETVEVVNKGNHFEDGIYLDWPPSVDCRSTKCSTTDAPALAMAPRQGAKHVIQFSGVRCASDVTPKVFVMNREGSTVATYRL